MRVLVVEDEQDVGDVFLDYLLELGHQPLLVRTAEAALGKLVTERPDAIIVDVNLPGMSGIEFLQLRPIRESGVPVVAVSAVATESQARECLRLGAVDFVGKPLPFERLQEVLTYLEPHALDRKLGTDEAKPDRRSAPRAPLTVPVRVVEYGGAEWQATSVDVSVGGNPPERPRRGARRQRRAPHVHAARRRRHHDRDGAPGPGRHRRLRVFVREPHRLREGSPPPDHSTPRLGRRGGVGKQLDTSVRRLPLGRSSLLRNFPQD